MSAEGDRTTSAEEVPLGVYIAGFGGWENYLAYTAGVDPAEDEEFRRLRLPRRLREREGENA